ncbi:hypothetical protein I302_104143 [Kwoniella bestiolae CBS 10118]|uniref:SET domain-containing protein n=1 Tax=Kwoniella bestiolae CBS 10118 TaxID=1296100 RepID=A0AAJ8M7W6_9TREE
MARNKTKAKRKYLPSPPSSLSSGVESLPISSGVESLPLSLGLDSSLSTLPSEYLPPSPQSSKKVTRTKFTPTPGSSHSPPEGDEYEEIEIDIKPTIEPDNTTIEQEEEGSDEESSVNLRLAHQICAFEYLFHEAMAAYHGLSRAAMRSSLKEKFDRSSLRELKREIRGVKHTHRERDISYMTRLMERITDTQRRSRNNIIPEPLMKLFEDSFLSALLNRDIELRTCRYLPDNQVGLFRRNHSGSRKTAAQPRDRKSKGPAYSSAIDMSGVELIVITLPNPRIQSVYAAEKEGFNPELCFEYHHNGKINVLLSLGFGRSINHACINNVEWIMPDEALEAVVETSDGGIAIQHFEFDQMNMRIAPGEELLADYGSYFAQNHCACPWGLEHNITSGSSEHDTSSDYEEKKSKKKSIKTRAKGSKSKRQTLISSTRGAPSQKDPKRRRTSSPGDIKATSNRVVKPSASTQLTSVFLQGITMDRPLENINPTSRKTDLYRSSRLMADPASSPVPFSNAESSSHRHSSTPSRSLPWGFTDADPEERLSTFSSPISAHPRYSEGVGHEHRDAPFAGQDYSPESSIPTALVIERDNAVFGDSGGGRLIGVNSGGLYGTSAGGNRYDRW